MNMQTQFITEKPQVTRKGILLTLFFWLVFTLLSTALIAYSNQVPVQYALMGSGLSSLIMLVYMTVVWFVLVRELYHLNWFLKFFLHGVTSITFTLAWFYTYLFFFDVFFDITYLDNGFRQNQAWIMFSTWIEYVLVFAVIHIIESLKQLRIKEKQTSELKELSRRQEIATLKAQLNPHFLFNTLNGINAMIMQQPAEAQEMVARLSAMLRYSLDSFEKEYVPLSDEISFIRTYLQLEKTRLGERLSVEYDIDENLSQVAIPPMICQPLVENAVKHGISPREEGGKVTISIKEHEDRICFEISDTGIGIKEENQPDHSCGIGLKNTRKMLMNRYGPESDLSIEATEPCGTRVTFSIPTQ